MSDVATQLTAFLKNGKDWARKATSIPGVFVQKMPESDKYGEARLAIELNPINPTTGNRSKRRGIYIGSVEEKQVMLAALQHEKLDGLIESLAGVNPEETVKDSKSIEL